MDKATAISSGWQVVDDGEAWDRMLAGLDGHPLQSALWGDARRSVEHLEDLRLACIDNGRPLFMARIETRRAPLLGKVAWIPRGPVRAGTAGNDLDKAFGQQLRRHGYALCVRDDYVPVEPAPTGVRTIWIDLSQGAEALQQRIDRQWMYGVRRAAREGVEVVCATSRDEVSEFYRMCAAISRSKGFELPGSEALMQQLLQAPMTGGLEMQLFLAKHDGKIGAGAFVARSGRHVHYFWGASDREMSRLRVGEAVQWAVIEWAIAEGCLRYDLEGIDPVNNPGVYTFKKKMGGEEVALAGKAFMPMNIQGQIIYRLARVTGRI